MTSWPRFLLFSNPTQYHHLLFSIKIISLFHIMTSLNVYLSHSLCISESIFLARFYILCFSISLSPQYLPIFTLYNRSFLKSQIKPYIYLKFYYTEMGKCLWAHFYLFSSFISSIFCLYIFFTNYIDFNSCAICFHYLCYF